MEKAVVPVAGKLVSGRARLQAMFAVGTVVAASGVMAAGEVATAITDLQTQTITNIGLVVTAAFAVLVVSLVPDIGLGLAKKWIKKGAS